MISGTADSTGCDYAVLTDGGPDEPLIGNVHMAAGLIRLIHVLGILTETNRSDWARSTGRDCPMVTGSDAIHSTGPTTGITRMLGFSVLDGKLLWDSSKTLHSNFQAIIRGHCRPRDGVVTVTRAAAQTPSFRPRRASHRRLCSVRRSIHRSERACKPLS